MKKDLPHGLVNIAVCGKFHYLSYLSCLNNPILNRFYCSARFKYVNTLPRSIKTKIVNLPLKEFLFHGHLRFFGDTCFDRFSALYVGYWQERCLANWTSAPIFHFMLHGNCIKLLRKAKKDGSIIIGEPVNAHPVDTFNRLNKEYASLGLDHFPNASLSLERMSEEVSLCDFLLSPSRAVTNSYVSLGFPANKIKTLSYGVDLNKFHPNMESNIAKFADQSVFQLICVAAITPRKGHIYLLEAWKILKLSKARLILVGSIDPCMKPILSQYSQLFIHVSHVPNHELIAYYSSSDAFVLASIEDGFGTVVTEAMACGLPVIVSDAVGASDLVHEGKNGFMVRSRSVDDIAKAIQFLYDSRKTCMTMGEAARLSASNFYSWEKYATNLADYYVSVLNH
jgi:glycosyltransferase involved in cell wall biosynthesis